MNKLRMHSISKTHENIEIIRKLFPNCITERKNDNGKLESAIDFDILRQELSSEIIEGREERYQFTWPDKKKSILLANSPIAKTLRPCKEESVDFHNTENIYIEGDNLDVLKLLQETYLGKIKMIYIDPPYNTGNDFVYDDDFAQSSDEYFENSGQFDDEGNRLVQNTESNGRFHTDWLNMMYPRLKLAKDLLSENGSIFISVDNNEVENIVKIAKEVFGKSNYIGTIANVNNPKGRSDDKFLATAHEYIIMLARNISELDWYGFEPTEVITKRFNKVDNAGKKYREIDLRKTGDTDLREDRPNLFYYFYYNQNTGDFYPSRNDNDIDGYEKIKPIRKDGSEGRWRWGLETTESKLWKLTPKFMPARKLWGIMEKDFLEEKGLVKPTTSWTFKDVNSERGTEEFIELGFDKRVFPKPKPIGTIKRCINLAMDKSDICLDFFSGSSTTAHSIMQLNAENSGHIKYIMVQLPEFTYDTKMKDKKDENDKIVKDEDGKPVKIYDIDRDTGYPKINKDSEARKSGYYTIPQIGKARIFKAGQKIKEDIEKENMHVKIDEAPKKIPDIGFRVLKLDSTNMKDVYYNPDDYNPTLFDDVTDNIKDDRTSMDLLFQVMLQMDVLLSSKIEEIEIAGKKLFSVMDNYMIACFDTGITSEIVAAIAKKQPYYAVFRDSCMADDSTMASFEQIFETFSKDSIRKVL